MEESDFTRTRRWVVVLDPGHGGEDLGARGQVGLYEKDVVLAIALEAERLLEAREDVQVELTRRVDEFVPLAMRTQFANQWSADAFVSLHNNASEERSLSGLQVFYLNAASDEAGRLLAERENSGAGAVEQLDDIDLILGDLTQSAKQEPSIALAHILNERILSAAKRVWPEVRASGVRPGPFYVLVGARMPCALVELFFIDHAGDGAQLARARVREAIARGLVSGINAYLDRLSDEHDSQE
jgi:N-acetylmuramoyl-L-alanine amidase